MSIFPSGDTLSTLLFGILLFSILALAGYAVVKLGAPRRTITHRGLKIRANLGLPAGKIVLVDDNWRPIGETSPREFETLVLPQGAVAAWLAAGDFAELESRKAGALRPLVHQPLRPDVGMGR